MEIRVQNPPDREQHPVPPNKSFDPTEIVEGESTDSFLYRQVFSGCFYDPLFHRILTHGQFDKVYGSQTDQDILVLGRFDLDRLFAVWDRKRVVETLCATINMLAQHFDDEPGVANAYEWHIAPGANEFWLVTRGSMQFADQLFTNVVDTYTDNLPHDLRERVNGDSVDDPLITFGVAMAYEAAQVVGDAYLQRYNHKMTQVSREDQIRWAIQAARVLISRRLQRVQFLGRIRRFISLAESGTTDEEPTMDYSPEINIREAQIVENERRHAREYLSCSPRAALAADCLYAQFGQGELKELSEIIDGFMDPDRSLEDGKVLNDHEEGNLWLRLLQVHSIRRIMSVAALHER